MECRKRRNLIVAIIPRRDFPALYQSAQIILDDHNPKTNPYGCINLRIFESFACRKPVITNGCDGIESVFREELFIYENADQINALVNQVNQVLINDPELPQRLRQTIIENHTFTHRAEDFCQTIRKYITDIADRHGD